MSKKIVLFVGAIVVFVAVMFVAKKGNESGEASLASTGSGDQQQILSDLNAAILSMKKKEDVLPTVKKIVAAAAADEKKVYPGVQLYAAVASLVPDLEGIFYRCREFVETSDWLHMSWLFGLRDFAYNDYLYGPHVSALFDFLTYPSHRAGKPFKSVSELQDYILNRIAPKVELALAEAAKLEKLPAENFEFWFDRTVFVGEGNGIRFLDPSEAKKLFIKPNFFTMEFLMQRALATMYYVSAMDLDELPIVFNRVIRLTTINTVARDLRIGNPAKGVTPLMTYEVIKGTKSFLKWRQQINYKGKPATAQQLLDKAFEMADRSAYYQLGSYVCGLKYPMMRSQGQAWNFDFTKDCMQFDGGSWNSQSYFVTGATTYLFNPNSMVLDFNDKYNMFKQRASVYAAARENRYASVLSSVTGESVRLNVRALFQQKTSQRDFLPTDYSSRNQVSQSVSDLPGVQAWNYQHGRPIAFNDYSFGGFFDPSEVKDIGSLYHAMSTVLYTPAIAPFALWIRVPSTARFFIAPSEIIRQ